MLNIAENIMDEEIQTKPAPAAENCPLLDQTKSNIKNIFANGGPRREGSPFRLLDSRTMEQVVYEAFKQKPWSAVDNLSINIDGQECPIGYKPFLRAGRVEDFKKWHKVAINRYLSTFDKVCELLSNRGLSSRYNGWTITKKWWPEIIKKAFEQKPFTPLFQLKLVYNGKVIVGLYDHARKIGSKEDMEYIQNIYEKVFQEYIEKSFENALEYIFSKNRRFLWEKVPKKWHKEFLKKCFEQNPFRGAHEGLKLTYNGKTVNAPANYYQSIGKYGELNKMMDEILREYISSMAHVVEFITHNDFSLLGGWKMVPEKYKRALVVNAVIQSTESNPTIKRLVYTLKTGESVRMINLFAFYRKNKQVDVFNRYIREALELKKKLGTEKVNTFAADAVAAKQKDKTAEPNRIPKPSTIEEARGNAQYSWISDPLSKEKLSELILKAKKGDAKARFDVVRSFGRMINSLARNFAKGDKEILRELIQDGIVKAADCVDHFELNRNVSFSTYLYKSLINEFTRTVYVYKKQWSSKQAITIGNNIKSELNKFTGNDKSINYIDTSAEEIAKIIHRKVKTVTSRKQAMTTSFVSLEAPKQNDKDKPVKDFIQDKTCGNTADTAAINEIKTLVADSIEQLDLRNQVLAKQYFNIKGHKPTNPYWFKEISRGKIDIKRVIEAVSKFQNKLQRFCENHEFGGETTINKLRAILGMSQNPEETMRGENALGKLLFNNGDAESFNIFMHIILSLEPTDSVIVSEIFNIPARSFSTRELESVFNITNVRIGKLINENIYPKLKRVLARNGVSYPA